MKKVLVSGLVAGAAMFVIGMAVNILMGMALPSLTKEYNNIFIFRPWKDPLMQLMFVQPFVLGLILAWVWDKTKKAISGKGINKGLNFGWGYMMISLPGMLISYSSFQVSLLMIGSWTLSILINGLVSGAIFSKLNK